MISSEPIQEKLTVESFYQGGKNGKLLGLECIAGHVTVPPRRSCLVCNSLELKVVELSGRATIVATTEVYSKSKEFPIEAPYLLALAKLEEGGSLLGVVKKTQGDTSKDVCTESKVIVKFEIVDPEGGETSSTKYLTERGRPRIFFERV
ncbi:MAG TPA: OB-fold domain-containing protein [Nitrososphaerales archaeon]|nr:OB-fold domain-containing protein [Nitrososphaerales archaeon]